MEILFTILVLILVVSLAGTITRITPIYLPLPLVQIGLGVIISLFGLRIHFEPEVFLLLFIPLLLFEDGRRTPLSEFLRQSREIVSLALVLVVVTVVGLGYVIHWLIPNMPLYAAFALAAVLSPTDAVALSSIVGKGRMPHSIMKTLEGEALMNDAAALILLKTAVSVATGLIVLNEIQDYFYTGIQFLWVAAGGLGSGIIVALFFSKALKMLCHLNEEDPATQVMFLLLLPFSAYLFAEYFGLSGILAAVAAGMTLGHVGVLLNAPLELRLRANGTWSMLEFVLNGMVFVLLGSQILDIHASTVKQLKLDTTIQFWTLFWDIVWIYAALMGVRFMWLSFMKWLSKTIFHKIPQRFVNYTFRDLLIATFAGVRGTITLAGALSIPLIFSNNGVLEQFPSRYQIVFLAMGVILLSLACAMITLFFLLKGYSVGNTAEHNREILFVQHALSDAALEEINQIRSRIANDSEQPISDELLAEVYARVVGSLWQYSDKQEQQELLDQKDKLERRFRLAALRAERSQLYHLRATRKISNETVERVLHELDLKEKLLTGRN